MKQLLWLLLVAAPLVPAQQKKIVVLGLPPAELQDLRAAAPGANIVPGVAPSAHAVTAVTPDAPENTETKQRLLAEVADADAFIGGPTREVIQAAKKLKWVQILSAGVEPYLYPELVESDIVMTNARAVASPGIADHALGMLLALSRKLNHFISVRRDEIWDRKPYQLLELAGKTAVVIGVGSIGAQVARRAKAFDMTVIGVNPKDLPPNPAVNRMVFPDRLDEVLPLADAVFVCAPYTRESDNMIGPRQFALLKKGSFFIAVSRGKLYSMEGLLEALDSRQLASAGLDVTVPEPLPKGHPLWRFDNVIITPHIATECDGEGPRRRALVKENVIRFTRGEQLRNVVNMRKGY